MYPTMTYRHYILKFALETLHGKFFCKLCDKWINCHRWIHFKKYHRYKNPIDELHKSIEQNKEVLKGLAWGVKKK